jgi:hypothetical protein
LWSESTWTNWCFWSIAICANLFCNYYLLYSLIVQSDYLYDEQTNWGIINWGCSWRRQGELGFFFLGLFETITMFTRMGFAHYINWVPSIGGGSSLGESLPSISNQLMGVSPLLVQVQLTIPLYANHGGKEKMLSSYGVIGNCSLTYTFWDNLEHLVLVSDMWWSYNLQQWFDQGWISIHCYVVDV